LALPTKQRECQPRPHQCFFVFVGSPPFFSPLVLPLEADPAVSVPVVAIVALMPDIADGSVAVVLVLDEGAVPVAIIPVPVVSVELVPVVAVELLDVIAVSVTAVSVFAFSSFLHPMANIISAAIASAASPRDFLMTGTPSSSI
jgi:hypothetical protein